MTELFKIKAKACAVLSVISGASLIAMMWLLLFSAWPMTIGVVILAIFQAILTLFFIGSTTNARVYADIKTLEK